MIEVTFRRHPDAQVALGVRVEACDHAELEALSAVIGPHLMFEWGRLVLVSPDGFQRTYLEVGDVILKGFAGDTEWDFYVVREDKLPRIWVEVPRT